MDVNDYLGEIEGISDELIVLQVVAKLPLEAARRHYARRVAEVGKQVSDLTEILACEPWAGSRRQQVQARLAAVSAMVHE